MPQYSKPCSYHITSYGYNAFGLPGFKVLKWQIWNFFYRSYFILSFFSSSWSDYPCNTDGRNLDAIYFWWIHRCPREEDDLKNFNVKYFFFFNRQRKEKSLRRPTVLDLFLTVHISGIKASSADNDQENQGLCTWWRVYFEQLSAWQSFRGN